MANEHSQIVPSMQPTAKVADFKFWCQKVLPLVYDDSLSYYEVLNKMVVYLNQVIDNINADIDNVAELEDDFLLLQEYVNNFFDDIDQLVTYTERAEAAETAALSSAASAAESATNAASSAVNAATSSGSAATSALSAMDAKDAAVAAKTAAEAALANAQTAATNAANSATAASNSATAASGSATNAATSAASALQNFQLSDAARVAAQEAAEDAADSATAAAQSAASADGAKAQAMIAEDEETTALSSHNIGDYFRIDGVLYVATADIQIGDTISTSTNCSQAVLGDDVSELKTAIINDTICSTAIGNPIKLTDAKNALLKSLKADGNCSVIVGGKNLLSGSFDQSTYTDRADEVIIIGKGGYEYYFPSRVTVISMTGTSMTFKVTASQVSTTGIGIYVGVKPNTKYVLSYVTESSSKKVSVLAYDSEGTYIGNVKDDAGNGYSFETDASYAYVCIAFRCNTQNEEITYTNFQLEEGTTPTGFIAYQKKQTVPVTSGTEADVSNINTYSPITDIYSLSDVDITATYYCDSKKYIDNRDSLLQEQINNRPTVGDVQANAFVSSYNSLDGWEAHAKAFSVLMEDVTDTEGFMFFTDTHFMAKQTESDWKEYAYAIFAYLEQLYYASPCSFVLHGGDWLGAGEAWDSNIYKLSTLGGIFRSRFDRFALLVGNHETGSQSDGNHTTTHGTLAATLLSNVGKTYYRFDANTFHMYCFDSWVSGAIDAYAKEQIAWFANSLEEETADHIVIAIHILYDSDVLKDLGDELTKCADAYNNGSTYTYDGTTYDFSSATGKVGFVIAGHEHGDETGTVNNIPYILTTNTTEYSETSFSSLPLPVDLIKVDWDHELLTAYRAARGSEGTTRTLSIIA